MDEINVIAKRFGDFVAAARVRQNMSQSELAARVGISQAYLSKIEKGLREPTITNALNLCTVLGLDINDFRRNHLL